MHILRHAHQVSTFISIHPDTSVTSLIHRRLSDLMGDEDLLMEGLVAFFILEPVDTCEQLEESLGAPIQTPEGHPLWELLEEHSTLYEMVIILSDDGFGAEILIPKRADMDPDLTSLCKRYAVPAQEEIDP